MAYVTPDQKAKTVARYLWEGYITVLGVPAKLISDQGPCFEAQIIQELCDLLGIQKIRTTSYHPQGNGQVERAHQTIMHMIGKLEEDEKDDWPSRIHALTHAYNCTRSAVTGYSPHYLMFGRRPRMPIDFYFPSYQSLQRLKKVDDYVADLQKKIVDSFRTAEALSQAEADRQKRYFDRRSNAVMLQPGDLVLTKLDAF
jgi:hypothetical protein